MIIHHHCSAQWSFSLRQNLENSATVGDCCFQLRVWHQNCLVSELLVLNSLEVDLNIILGSTDCSLQTSHRHLTNNNLKTTSVGNNRFGNDHLALSSFWNIFTSCSSSEINYYITTVKRSLFMLVGVDVPELVVLFALRVVVSKLFLELIPQK